MNIQKFTQKSMEAVNACEKLAMEYGNQELEQEHLLYGLLTIEDSLILKLIEKMVRKIADFQSKRYRMEDKCFPCDFDKLRTREDST